MSADDAWDEYEHLNYAEEPDMEHVERAFMAGYRRALEDAADAIEHLPIQKTAAALRLNAAAELRARAAAADPTERSQG